jgi:chromate transporter
MIHSVGGASDGPPFHRYDRAVHEARDRPQLPSELRAALLWFWLGAIGFGGPAGQIALMHRELVERRKWLSERRFLRALSFCMALPGPEATQLIAYCGYTLFGVRGALVSGTLFVLPGAVLMTVLTAIYVAYGDVDTVQGVVRGLTIAVVAVVLAAVIRIGRRVLKGTASWVIGGAAFAALIAGVPFPLVLLSAAVAGILIGRRHPEWMRGDAAEHHAGDGSLPAAHGSWHAMRRRAAIGLAIWLVPVAALVIYGGVLGDLAWFFSAAALITFGGAYAVLPFVAQYAVEHFHWLTNTQMIAGLGLGETTPGPLILVNTFVGYMAGDGDGGTGMALAGAAVATYATFAPSFLFIILGAPLIERIPDEGPIADALLGMTIAVVGVVAALGVFVARHVLVDDGSADVFACVLAAGAFVALRFERANVVLVIAACAAAGLIAEII